MINWAEFFTTNNQVRHHAFLIAGEPAAILPPARAFLQTDLKINPAEIYEWVESHFKIADSRVLKEHLSAPVAGEHRFILVGFYKIEPEAEQALLKILEEPPRGIVFIMVTPRPLNLPATILSRVWLVDGERTNLTSQLLAGAPAARLNLLTKEVARTEREGESIESLAWPALSAAEHELSAELTAHTTPEAIARGQDLNLLRQLLTHKLAARSPKNILEYLTLIWPRL